MNPKLQPTQRRPAQVNVARLRAPLDAPELAGFVAGLALVNPPAEAAPGFVWRPKDGGGNATRIPFPHDSDPLLIVNPRVWGSWRPRRAFAYSGVHPDFLKRRREWFLRLAAPLTSTPGPSALASRPPAAGPIPPARPGPA